MTVAEPGSSPATPPEVVGETPPAAPPPAMTPPPMAPPPISWTPAPPIQPGPMPGLRYGGFWVRTVAWIIDGIILAVIGAALSPLLGATFPVQSATGATGIQFLIDLVYFMGFWVWRAQTPGMSPFGMRVVRADNGENIDVGRAILRYVGLIISFVVLALGVIWVAFDGRKQGWHDKLAGTVVVRPVGRDSGVLVAVVVILVVVFVLLPLLAIVALTAFGNDISSILSSIGAGLETPAP
jgi:uncharacterized RDD family membrane protein YckC